jgi:serine/threonine protein kinase
MASKGFAQEVAHYRIVERIGEGGMGEVYKAVDLRLNRTVALKFIAQQDGADDSARQRLLEEARAAAALNHPHIATVYELGQANGLSFIAMEHVEGESLARLIERGPLSIDAALDIAIQIAEALDAAHARGIVHCDIKGANVIIAGDGSIKVFDFGLARIIASTARESSGHAAKEPADGRSQAPPDTTTVHAVIEGTASYMSPEQARPACRCENRPLLAGRSALRNGRGPQTFSRRTRFGDHSLHPQRRSPATRRDRARRAA